MEFSKRSLIWGLAAILGILLINIVFVGSAGAQSTYTAQLTGVVMDSSGAVVPGAKVILTDQGTNISVTHESDNRGIYVFTECGLRPTRFEWRHPTLRRPNEKTWYWR